MKTLIRNTLILVFGLNSGLLFAADDIEELGKAIAKRLPQVEVTRIDKTPVSGIYQVIVGPQVVYMTKDAQYMIDGDLVDLSTRKNFTEDAKAAIRMSEIEDFGESDMVVYTPPKEVKHTITVVTDINCPYCRRLHSEMPKYMENGIKVRYIFMPLKGPDDVNKTISVWCADDRNAALDIAKAGGEVEARKCDNPIMKQMELARKLGVRGTPAIILENGDMLPGYVPVDTLVKQLDTLKVSAAL
jgi:thiol:disulfide interchange protein DsbC